MYKLIIYKMPKSGRWRWKFQYNNRVLARADYHYASAKSAEKSFENIAKALNTETPAGVKIYSTVVE